MKKQFLLFVAATLVSISSLIAQDNARPRQTPEERTKMTMEKLSTLNLSADVKAKTEVIFNDFYTASQKSMQEMRASGNPDREAMKTKHMQLVTERNDKLKLILTPEQMKTWVNDIEPGLRPQRNPPPAITPAPAPSSPLTPAPPVKPN